MIGFAKIPLTELMIILRHALRASHCFIALVHQRTERSAMVSEVPSELKKRIVPIEVLSEFVDAFLFTILNIAPSVLNKHLLNDSILHRFTFIKREALTSV